MSNIARLVLIIIVLPVLLLITPEGATASCRCSYVDDPRAALYNASAVFAGKVVGIGVAPGTVVVDEFLTVGMLQVTFQVTKVWKGPVRDKISVLTQDQLAGSSYTSCGYNFVAGTEYLVYVDGPEDQLAVSICGRTRELQGAEKELWILGPGQDPSSWLPWYIASNWPVAVVVAVLESGLIAALIIIRKRDAIRAAHREP